MTAAARVAGPTAALAAASVVAQAAACASLDLLVVAEGVETREEYDYLRDAGCGAVQGCHLSRPLSAADFAGWPADHPARQPAA